MKSKHPKIVAIISILAGVTAAACAVAPLEAGTDSASSSEQELSRSWTCNATLSYGAHSYTPANWNMSSSQLFPDREDYCRDYIKNHWLRDPDLLNLLGVAEAEKNQICASADTVTIRIDYGFDRRPKSWQFTSAVSAGCPARNYACGFAMANVSGNPCENGRTTRYVSAPDLNAAIGACQAAQPAEYPLFCVVLDQDGTAPTDASECQAAPTLGSSGQAPAWRPTRSCCRFQGETTCPL